LKLFNVFNSKQIRVAAVGGLTIKFLSAFFALLNGVMLARMLSIEDFGMYVLAFTTINIIAVPISLGFPTLIMRYIPKYIVSNDMASIKGLLIKTNSYIFFAHVIAFLLIIAAYYIWWNRFPESTITTFWYAFSLMPFLVFGSLRAAALRGLKLIILGELPETLLRNFILSVALLVYFFFKFELTPERAMLLHLVAGIMAFLSGYVFLKRKLLNQLRNIKPSYHRKEWVKQAIPYSVTQLVSILKKKSITYILVIFGSLEAVALFDVAMRGATLVSFTLSALNNAVSPFISAAFTQNNIKSVQKIVTKSNRIIFVFALPVALVFIIGGEPLISWVFGEAYALAYIPLAILCISQLVNALAGSAGPVLNMTGNQSYLSRNQIHMMILSLALSIPLVIYYDVLGGAIAFSLVLVVQNILLVWFIKKRLNVNMTIF